MLDIRDAAFKPTELEIEDVFNRLCAASIKSVSEDEVYGAYREMIAHNQGATAFLPRSTSESEHIEKIKEAFRAHVFREAREGDASQQIEISGVIFYEPRVLEFSNGDLMFSMLAHIRDAHGRSVINFEEKFEPVENGAVLTHIYHRPNHSQAIETGPLLSREAFTSLIKKLMNLESDGTYQTGAPSFLLNRATLALVTKSEFKPPKQLRYQWASNDRSTDRLKLQIVVSEPGQLQANDDPLYNVILEHDPKNCIVKPEVNRVR